MKSACSRTWEAAARDDGRLSASDRASFERHVEVCPDCRREIAAFSELSSALARAVPAPVTPLAHQRARGKLLARANAAMMEEEPSSWRGFALAGAAALVLLGTGFGVYRHRSHVDVVATPDRVTPPSARAAGAPQAEEAANDRPTDPIGTIAHRSAAAPSHHPAARVPVREPGPAFDDAFASYEQGAYGIADLKLERFIHDFPGDPRAEDASFLRALARFKLGDHEGAAALARTYLDDYPTGLRRPEAQRIADAP